MKATNPPAVDGLSPRAMPIHEFVCTPCEKTFEVFVLRRADEDEVACPSCASREVTRQLSRTAAPRTGAPAPRACGPIG